LGQDAAKIVKGKDICYTTVIIAKDVIAYCQVSEGFTSLNDKLNVLQQFSCL
jgi:hypothetical protein